MRVKSATAKRSVGTAKRRTGRPQPLIPTAGVRLDRARYGCGGKLKK